MSVAHDFIDFVVGEPTVDDEEGGYSDTEQEAVLQVEEEEGLSLHSRRHETTGQNCLLFLQPRRFLHVSLHVSNTFSPPKTTSRLL